MIVISVANSIDICSFKLFVLQIAFKYSLNGCMIADSKWTGTRQPRCCILSTNLTSFITRGGRVERFSNSIFLNIDFPNFFLLEPNGTRNQFALHSRHVDSLESQDF